MEKVLLFKNSISKIEFVGEQIASSDWIIEPLQLSGFARIYLTDDGRLVVYSEQWESETTSPTNVEKNSHIILIGELESANKRNFLTKLIFGDVMLRIRNELRTGFPTEIESQKNIQQLAIAIAKRLGFDTGNETHAQPIHAK